MIVLDLRRARNKEEYEFLCNVAVDISLRALLDPSDSQASVTDSQPFSRLTDGHQLFKPSQHHNAKQRYSLNLVVNCGISQQRISDPEIRGKYVFTQWHDFSI